MLFIFLSTLSLIIFPFYSFEFTSSSSFFPPSVVRDRNRASLPLLLDAAEDECGGQALGGETHGRLLKRGAGGGDESVQGAHRSGSPSLCSVSSSAPCWTSVTRDLVPSLQCQPALWTPWTSTPGRASGWSLWPIGSWSPNSPGTKSTTWAGNVSADNCVCNLPSIQETSFRGFFFFPLM